MRTSRPPPPPPPPLPNSSFGKYRLLDRIAVGGMAEVFRALEPRPAGEPRLVVIKRMLPAISSQPGARAMFLAEANVGQLVRHRNVVEVLGFGHEEDQPYLTLEYIRGLDLWRLGRWLRRNGKTLSVPLSVLIVREMLAGLASVHESRSSEGEALEIVHRDVSPSNVLVSVHGDVKLGDFGIARTHLHQQHPQAPLTERAKGKLGYMAPEQVAGEPCDQRADVFSAAIVATELLMGRPLFAGGSELAVLLAIRDAKIHPFVEIISSLPAGLGDVIVRALARRPEDRTESAASLARELAVYQNEPEEDLRKVLGELVRSAMGTDDGPQVPAEEQTPVVGLDALASERTPDADLQELVDRSGRISLPGLPRHPMPSSNPPRGMGMDIGRDIEDALGSTAKIPAADYRVRTTDGTVFGPWAYAEVIEAVATGKLGPDDEVSTSSGPFEPLHQIDELRRHLMPSTSLTPTSRRHKGPAEADEVWDLRDGGIVSGLARLVVRRDTGLLLCEQGGVRKEVYLKDGVPEFVTSNLASELLGEFLVKKGVITRGELDMALAVMPRFEGRLGDTLTGLGLVEPVHLFQHIASQVREKLLDLFAWTHGKASLYRGVPPPQSGFPLVLDPWRILDEGIDRRIKLGLGDEREEGRILDKLVAVGTHRERSEETQLPAELRRILATLQSRPRALGELMSMFDDPAGRDLGRTYRCVVLLLRLGAVAWS